jgi:cytochrome c oxidase assembly protein subunit 11
MSRPSNRRLGLYAGGAGAVMLGLAFAADPLYDTFCRVTGYGGTTRQATGPASQILEQTIQVRFDANVADTGVTFRPLQTEQTVRLGAHALAYYEVTNPSDREVGVIASYNVTPHMAGSYFNKLECFCFTERRIGPGETMKLPIVYFIAPEIASDRVVQNFETITLSYTFFDSLTYQGPREDAAAKPQGAANTPG